MRLPPVKQVQDGRVNGVQPSGVVVQAMSTLGEEEGLGALRVSVERVENGPWISVRCVEDNRE